MVSKTDSRWIRSSALRVVASAALVSVMVGACSSVPDAVNPVRWYEKTTDFFSGDNQAAETAQNADGGNQGLAADPNAPPPAPAETTEEVAAQGEGGLSADAASSNYASPPIDRQGAPTDVLRSEPATQTADAGQQPPPPEPAPTRPVMSAPAEPVRAPDTLQTAEAPPAPPSGASTLDEMPKAFSMEGAPPPPTLNTSRPSPFADPYSDPYGGSDFETVVISGDGMETQAAPRTPQLAASGDGMSSQRSVSTSGARFPEPGATTSGQSGQPAPAGHTRVATIHFANASADLDARDRSILEAVVQLQRERGGRVVVVGHASSRTKDMDYIRHQMVNFEMSMERAATVGNVLKDLGLSGERLDVEAVSDARPLYLEVMPSGEAGNRRVEIYLAS